MPAGERSFDFAVDRFETYKGGADICNLKKVSERGHDLGHLPYSIKVLLENAIRNSKGLSGATEAANQLLEWPRSIGSAFPFVPFRVLLQDYTGVPLVVDLAAMRDSVFEMGRDPRMINSIAPVDLVIDHSVQVDSWGNAMAFEFNIESEYERNSERYALLKWAQDSFQNMRVFPPGKGICHQVNLEYLSTVVAIGERDGRRFVCPDTVVGTDSHTTMVNGLGVVGWGVGGLEAEAAMLGEPCHIPIPRVVGVRLKGELQEGATPTDLVLFVTELLRKKNVIDAFVEYFGEGYQNLSVPDRATLGNMTPEYGATIGFSPVDAETIRYLHETGREKAQIKLVEEYCKLQGLFLAPDSPDPHYSEVLEVDMSKIEPSVAGPRNPEERHGLRDLPGLARSLLADQARGRMRDTATTTSNSAAPLESQLLLAEDRSGPERPRQSAEGLTDGSVIIAAITSCTNTSNPTVMIGAGLLARNAVIKGLAPKPFVKCSLAPGSAVVKEYLEGAGLLADLDRLGFYLVGYGCTTCIGNSGPLSPEVERAIAEKDLYVVAALSGNRNFDGRINRLAKGAFLMSPMLVVAYALAGEIGFDFSKPLGNGKEDGKPVYLKDLWPSQKEIRKVVEGSISRDLYRRMYSDALVGDERWNALSAKKVSRFQWDDSSTYVRSPPWFKARAGTGFEDIAGARPLAILGDKITTDHISPAGVIPADSSAGSYLMSLGVDIAQLSTFGSRRGNHEVMVRGGFSNPRLKNFLCEEKVGGYTRHFPSGDVLSFYDASVRYGNEDVPLLVIAGKQYGGGSSRDWAAKAPKLLGVRAVIAESFERIHRSNLVAMGILPLEFQPGEGAARLGLRGDEVYSISGLKGLKQGGGTVEAGAASSRGETKFRVKVRIDNKAEVEYFENGGILPYTMKKLTA